MSYRPVHERFWRDPSVRKLTPGERYLFLYFITCPDAHYSGLYYCPIPIIMHETGLSEKSVRMGIDTLSNGYMIGYDMGTEEVFVANMAKFQAKSEKQRKGIERHFKESVQSQTLVNMFAKKYPEINIPYPYPIDTLSNGYAYPTDTNGIPTPYPTDTTETETETETESLASSKYSTKSKIPREEQESFQKKEEEEKKDTHAVDAPKKRKALSPTKMKEIEAQIRRERADRKKETGTGTGTIKSIADHIPDRYRRLHEHE